MLSNLCCTRILWEWGFSLSLTHCSCGNNHSSTQYWYRTKDVYCDKTQPVNLEAPFEVFCVSNTNSVTDIQKTGQGKLDILHRAIRIICMLRRYQHKSQPQSCPHTNCQLSLIAVTNLTCLKQRLSNCGTRTNGGGWTVRYL